MASVNVSALSSLIPLESLRCNLEHGSRKRLGWAVNLRQVVAFVIVGIVAGFLDLVYFCATNNER